MKKRRDSGRAVECVLRIVFLFALVLSAGAVDYFVDASRPNDLGDGLSWLTAKQTIQSGVDVAMVGDTVWVTNGYYSEGGAPEGGGFTLTNRVFAAKPITIKSVNGQDVTVIRGANMQGDGAVRGVFLSSGAVMEGFSIEDGGTFDAGDATHEQTAGGAWVATNSVLRDCTIRRNSARDGAGGVYLFQGGVVENCVITENSVDFSLGVGGGVRMNGGGVLQFCEIKYNSAGMGGGVGSSGGSIRGCTIYDNDAQSNGGGIRFDGGGDARDCLIKDNTATNYGAGILFDFGGKAHGCTIVRNRAGLIGGGVAYYSEGELVNGIVWENFVGVTLDDIGSVSTEIAISNINVCAGNYVTAGTDGCIDGDPQFMDPSLDDFRLAPSSPCYNTGNNGYVTSTDDLHGEPRVMFGAVDMGAIERQYLMTDYSGPAAGGNTIVITNGILGDGFDIDSVMVCGVPASVVGQGVNWVEIVLGDAGSFVGDLKGNVLVHSMSIGETKFVDAYTYRFTSNMVYYADASQPNDSGDGMSWATAKRTIQAAVDLAAGGEYVLVADGLYDSGGAATGISALTNRVCLDFAVTVIAVDGPEMTQILGSGPLSDNAVRGVYVGPGAALDGFHVVAGYTREAGASVYEDRCGGGIFVDVGGHVKQCVIDHCFASEDGGGAYVAGRMEHCTIKSNVNASVRGGGVCVSDGGQLLNSVVLENTGIGAVYMKANGGSSAANLLVAHNMAGATEPAGVLIESDSVSPQRYMLNCTIVDNAGDGTGIEGMNTLRGQYQNCIIYDNLTEALGDSIYSNCCLQTLAGVTGGDNGTNDPYFVDGAYGNFHLESSSWCVGAGDVNALTNQWPDLYQATDLEGVVRVQRDTVDLGCYEYPQGPNGALQFNGVNQFADMGLRLGGLSAMTVEAWIFLDHANASNRLAHICSKEFDSELCLYGDRLQFNVGNGSSWGTPIVSVRTLATGVWYHVAAVWDSTSTMGYLYVDGVPEATATMANYMGFSGYKRYIGASDTSAQGFDETFFPGRIDELRIWSTNRFLSEIQQTMFVSLDGNESGLEAYFPFNQQGGDIAIDYSLNRWPALLGSSIPNGTLAEWVMSDAVVADTRMKQQDDVGAIWSAESVSSILAPSGMEVMATLVNSEERIVLGNDAATGVSNLDIPSDVSNRLARVWYADLAGSFSCDQVFTLSNAQWGGGTNSPSVDYALLHRTTDSGTFSNVMTNASAVVGEVITFVDVPAHQGYYTLGMRSRSDFGMTASDGSVVENNEGPVMTKGTQFPLGPEDVTQTHYFTITNRGAARLEITGMSTNGSEPAAFIAGSIPSGIDPHDSALISVTYDPHDGGEHSANFVFNNNSLFPVFTMNLSGTAFSVTPSNGPAGGGDTVAVIAGALGNGSDISSITVCGYPAMVGTQGGNWVNFQTGAGPFTGVTGDVVIHSDSLGDTILTNGYTYNPAGVISNVSPSSGSTAGGFSVSISGTNLCNGSTGDVTSVTLNGIAVTSIDEVFGSTQIVVSADTALAGTGDVVVNSVSYGMSLVTNAFTYLDPAFMACSPLVLNYNGAYGGGAPSVQLATLSNTGGMPMNFTNVMAYGAGAADWFSLDTDYGAVAGGGSSVMTGQVDNTGLHPAIYSMTNYFTSLEAGNSPLALVVHFTVVRGNQTLAFPAIGDQYVPDSVGLNATSSSGLPVTFSVTSGPGVISGTTNLTFVGTGVVSVVASQPGDSDWNAAMNLTNSFAVSKANAAVVLGDLNQPYNGSPRVVTATTMPIGLTVDFEYDGGSTAPVTAGSYTVVGTVNDSAYAGASTGTLMVAKASQTISFPVIGDQLTTNSVGLHAVSTAGLSVSFSVGSGPALIVGMTNLTFTGAGVVSVVASQVGDSDWNAAIPVTNTFNVTTPLAPTYRWTGAADDQWTNRSNWVDGVVPVYSNNVRCIATTGTLHRYVALPGSQSIANLDVSGGNETIVFKMGGRLLLTNDNSLIALSDGNLAFYCGLELGNGSMISNAAGSLLFSSMGLIARGGLSKSGAGDLMVGRTNYFGGNLQINGGALKMMGDLTFAANSYVSISMESQLASAVSREEGAGVVYVTNGVAGTMAAEVYGELVVRVLSGGGNDTFDFGENTLYLSAGSRLKIVDNGTALNPTGRYTIARYASLSGTFGTMTGLTSHTVQYGTYSITLEPVVSLGDSDFSATGDTVRADAAAVYLDYDGDRCADITVFWPEQGMWYILQSGTMTERISAWGWNECIPLTGDFDGDGLSDLAVYSGDMGTWYILSSITGRPIVENWGWSDALPVPGDYDGDGITDMAVYSAANGVWHIWQSQSGTSRIQEWGGGYAVPVAGDYDGDGETDVAVYSPKNGTWYILQSTDQTARIQAWGWADASPIPGDYDGDGKMDIAVYWPDEGWWNVLYSADEGTLTLNWGCSTMVPSPADYDGDAIWDPAVYQAGTGMWNIWQSETKTSRVQAWGMNSAYAVPW